MLEQSYYNKTDDIIAIHGAKAESLIPIIQDIQAEYRYLPAELLCYVSKKIGITEAKAFSVATFYENFSFWNDFVGIGDAVCIRRITTTNKAHE